MDGEVYDYKQELAEKNIAEFMDLYEKYHNKKNDRIRIRFGPQGCDFVSPESLAKIKAVSYTHLFWAMENGAKLNTVAKESSKEISNLFFFMYCPPIKLFLSFYDYAKKQKVSK